MGGHAGQRDEDKRAGWEGTRPKRKGFRTVQNGSAQVILLGGGNASMSERKKREILGIERWQHGGTGAGQGGLLESAPNWRGTRVYYLTHAKKAKPQKEEPTDRGEKKCF